MDGARAPNVQKKRKKMASWAEIEHAQKKAESRIPEGVKPLVSVTDEGKTHLTD